MRKLLTKRILIIFLIVVIVAIAAVSIFGIFRITVLPDLKAEQIGNSIYVKWGKIHCDHYQVTVNVNGKERTNETTDKCNFKVNNIKANEKYEIKVTAIKGNSKNKSAGETVTTKKSQKITTVVNWCDGFEYETFNLKAKSQGNLTFRSNKPKVASVDESGQVYLNKVGNAVITVLAEETETQAKNIKKIKIGVYPKKLDSINLKKEYIDPVSVKLSWNKVDYAQKYLLMKYNSDDGKYDTLKEFKNDTLSAELTREDSKYIIKAESYVHGTTLESQSSSCQVESAVSSAKAYSSFKIVETLDLDKLDLVANISGAKGISVPQSMCYTGSEYIIVFVNRANSKGLLKTYTKDGKVSKAKLAQGMKHGNGCTYNPKTNKIYVCPTYAGHNTRAFVTFNGKTLEPSSRVNLNRAPSGVAYDSSNNRYYASASHRLYVMDENFNIIKTLKRKQWKQSQDMGAYSGVALSCIWRGGNKSYIDMYRVEDGAYIGSYHVPLGEIESVCVDNGHLVILMNKRTDAIYRTKEPIDFGL